MAEGAAAVAERSAAEKELGIYPESLKFRFGFLCQRADEAGSPSPDRILPKVKWRNEWAGPFVIRLHPETRLARHSEGERHLLLLGDAYEFAKGAPPDPAALLAAGESGLLEAVDGLGGRFALLLVEGNRLRALNDAIGSRALFYHAGAPFALGSHPQLVARAAGTRRRKDIPALIDHPRFRARKVKYLPGDWTIYENVFGLVPNNLYDTRANRGAGGTCRYWPRVPLRPGCFDAFLATATDYMRAQATFAGSHYLPLFGLTGGVDTRCVFASFRAFRTPFETVTWLDNLAPGEIETIRELSTYLGVPHRAIRNSRKRDPVAQVAMWNGGCLRGPGRRASAMLHTYGHEPPRAFMRCWGGEVMRGFYNTFGKSMRSLAPQEMARAWGAGPDDESGYAPAARAAFEEFFARGNYGDLDGFGYDPNDIFYWEHRMGMWGATANNELDPAMTTLIGMNGRPLFAAALALPPERRLTKRLLLELTDRFDPVLARIPLGPGTPKNLVSVDAPSEFHPPHPLPRGRSRSAKPSAAQRSKVRRLRSFLGRLRRRLGV
jgi:hypothetical protein